MGDLRPFPPQAAPKVSPGALWNPENTGLAGSRALFLCSKEKVSRAALEPPSPSPSPDGSHRTRVNS